MLLKKSCESTYFTTSQNLTTTQPAFTCLKLTKETPEQYMKIAQS